MKRTLIRLFLASILVVGYLGEKIYSAAVIDRGVNSVFLKPCIDIVSNEGNRLLLIGE